MNEMGTEEFAELLRAAAAVIGRNARLLSELDAAIGDGDHGTTISRSMERMTEILDAKPLGDLKSLLQRVGESILNVHGGATGPLFGSFFLGLSEGIEGRTAVNASILADMFSSAERKVLKLSGASTGDKTLVDALVPAVAALRQKVGKGETDICQVLRAAAAAGDKGAKDTTGMKARKGRARNMAERSIGHQDPGATSMALLFEGLAAGASQLNVEDRAVTAPQQAPRSSAAPREN